MQSVYIYKFLNLRVEKEVVDVFLLPSDMREIYRSSKSVFLEFNERSAWPSVIKVCLISVEVNVQNGMT